MDVVLELLVLEALAVVVRLALQQFVEWWQGRAPGGASTGSLGGVPAA